MIPEVEQKWKHYRIGLGSFSYKKSEPKLGPKFDPNRIFDAEALGRLLGSLLERSWKPLGTLLDALGALLVALGAFLARF